MSGIYDTTCVDCGRPITHGSTRCKAHTTAHNWRAGVFANRPPHPGRNYPAVPAGLRSLSEADAVEAAELVRMIAGAVVGR